MTVPRLAQKGILIDALYINNSGGKILLDYLVSKLEDSKIRAYYIFDERCNQDFDEIPEERKTYLKASLLERYLFYNRQRESFSTIFCFGNLPPPIKLKANVFTYLHQRLFLETPDSLGFKTRLLIKIKANVFKFMSKNSDEWIVQTNSMKDLLSSKIKIQRKKIKVLPFYPPLEPDLARSHRVPSSFIYVSSGSSHKNHKRLVEAFCLFYDKYKQGSLTLTIDKQFRELCGDLESKISKGYPIKNLGSLERSSLGNIYSEHEYLFFPSLSESFGLGLVEAIECGCNVIGADLEYTFAVCKPSIVFNPLSIESMVNAFSNALIKNEKKTKQLIFNQIDILLHLIQS